MWASCKQQNALACQAIRYATVTLPDETLMCLQGLPTLITHLAYGLGTNNAQAVTEADGGINGVSMSHELIWLQCRAFGCPMSTDNGNEDSKEQMSTQAYCTCCLHSMANVACKNGGDLCWDSIHTQTCPFLKPFCPTPSTPSREVLVETMLPGQIARAGLAKQCTWVTNKL